MRPQLIKFLFSTFILLTFIFGINAQNSSAIQIKGLDDYLLPDTSKTISMDFKQANLNDVLKIFSQQSGLNFIASSEIADKMIDLYLDNVPVEAALEQILYANDLTYALKPDSNIFVVQELDKPEKALITRVYHLKHATVPSSKMIQQIEEEGDDGSEDGSSSSSSDSSDEGGGDGGIVEAIESILTDDGTVVENARTNSLVITDIATSFPVIEETISRLDIRIPQVLIEAEMLDISKNTSDKLGIKYGESGTFQPITFRGASVENLLPFEDFPFDTGQNPPSITQDGFEFTASTLSYTGLFAAMEFIRTQTDTRNLARPRILTLNNETAQIEISTEEAIGTTLTTSGEGAAAQSTSEAERFETGVFLKVTPQANVKTGEITMVIEPKVIESIVNKNNSNFVDPEERGSKSVLRIKDGDTIILGGLLRAETTNIKTKIPILSKIPILGMPFRHKDKSVDERELIIFLTPHILNETTTPKNIMANNSQNTYREQDIPTNRIKAVNRDLRVYENDLNF